MRRAPVVRRSAAGMTLPELMVGLAVGVFVVMVAIATFVSTRKLNVVNSASTRMTENARLATETLHTDLRSAGFAGCRTFEQRLDGPPVVLLNSDLDTTGFISQGNSGVRGFNGAAGGHSPALPSVIATALTNASLTAYAPLATSDVVSVRVPADNVTLGLVSSMTSTTDAPTVQAALATNTITLGDVVLVSNCKASAIFQVTAANPKATGILTHASGTLTPGNAGTDLQHVFRSDANVYRLQTRHYYVAPSKLRTGTNALWRLSVPAPAGGTLVPEEVASGIDRLVIDYGVDSDTTPDLNVNRYLKADAVADWDRVLSARVQLVAATAENGMAQGNQQYKFNGATETAPDKRLRTVLTEVVTLRNGAP